MLVGASGSGKTTLLKLAKGLVPIQRGTFRLLGDPVPNAARARLDHRVAYIPQQLGLVRSRSVLENTLVGALWRLGVVPSFFGWFPGDMMDLAHQRLRSLGIGHKAMERVQSLSGGERQRVAIARALMQEPRVLLADESTSQLDPVTAREILGIMRGIADEGVTLLIATHQVELVGGYADRVVALRAGEKVLEANAADVTEDDMTAALSS
ncbi:MAG: transporter related [Chloroflexi bacterium]|nr:transporter related [Chloroflexota bacterium]